MNPIEAAILRTVLYADVFNFPLTTREIHHFLIHHEPIEYDRVAETLDISPALQGLLNVVEGYVIYGGRNQLISLRKTREQASEHLWPQAVKYGAWLARLPFVRMVALTGSLAVRNAAHDEDDLDYILVTEARRVWIARAFSIIVVRLVRLRGIEVCPNYVLAENALEQDQQDIFMAHEVTQMIPLHGHGLYDRFRSDNRWVDSHLPNANGSYYAETEYMPRGIWHFGKRTLEMILGGGLGDWIERWEYGRKLRRFATDLHIPHSSAKLDDKHVKGHFNDHGHPVLQRYHELLREYELEDISRETMAGD